MPRSVLPPYLMQRGTTKLCSACGHPFPKDVKPSLSRAFRKHVEEVHRAPKTDSHERLKFAKTR